MAASPRKLTPSLAAGLSVLSLQTVAAPFVLASLVGVAAESPRWLVGLYVALELGTIMAAVLLGVGLLAKLPRARFAPAVLILPYWAAVAAAAPALHQGAAAVAFALFSVSMGAVTALPFATARAKLLFEPTTQPAAAAPRATVNGD